MPGASAPAATRPPISTQAASRKAEADRVFIAQHGATASIERTADGWRIDPHGLGDPTSQPEQLALFEEG